MTDAQKVAEGLEREHREGFIAGFMEAGGRHSSALYTYRRWQTSTVAQVRAILQEKAGE